jgi:hypothetical protein
MTTPNSTVEIQFRLHATGPSPGKTAASDAPPSGNGRLPRVTQVMALAIQFQDMIQRGEARDYADLARLGCLTREHMSQIMELIWLAPDIQQDLIYMRPTLSGRCPISEVAMRKIAGLLDWSTQRQQWSTMRARLG